MSNCTPCPPCEGDLPLVCEPHEAVTQATRILVEDDAFCTKALVAPSAPSVLRTDSNGELDWASGANGDVITIKNGQPEFVDGSSAEPYQIPALQANTTTSDTRLVTQQNDGTIRHWRPASSTATPRLAYDKNGVWEIDTLNNLLPAGNGTVFIRDGAGALQAVTGVAGDILQIVGATPQFVTSSVSAPFPAGHLYGLILSNNVSTPNTIIDVTPGECRSQTGGVNIALVTSFSKSISSAFTAGTNNGGRLDVSAYGANATVHVFVIQGTGGTDIAFYSAVDPSSVLPAAFNQAWRRIGSITTDGSSNIRAFSQVGDRFLYKATPVEFTTASVSTGGLTVTLTGIPVGIKVSPAINVMSVNVAYFSIYDLDNTGWPSSSVPGPGGVGEYVASGSRITNNGLAFINCNSPGFIYTNTSGQIGFDVSSSSTFNVDVWGWIDHRNRLQP